MQRLRVILLGGVLAVLGGILSVQAVLATDQETIEEIAPDIIVENTTEPEIITEPDFIPTPPQLKFIKFQLGDSTRSTDCQAGAEFVLIRNFGASADLSDVQLKVGSSTYDLVTTQSLKTGEILVFYNKYFIGVPAHNCAVNTLASQWLAQQSQTVAFQAKSGIFQSSVVKLVLKSQPDVVIDEVDLGALQADKSHDTLVAQTNAQAEIMLTDGRVVWRSLRAHIPEQHWLSYGSLVLYEEVEPEPKNLCQGLVLSEVAVNVAQDKQFIEIRNATNEIINLTGCRLWTNWSGLAEYVFDEVELGGQQYLAVFLKDTKLQLSKTDVAKVELRNELGEVVDKLTIEPLTPNSSYAQMGTEFVKTFALTPNLPNLDLPELSCNVGYIFSQTTGACQKVTIASDVPNEETTCAAGYEIGFTGTCVKVCAAGFERNPETNRCRRVATELVSVLAPCPIGYYRNPETNRCRKITVTTQAGLSPCPIGYERNPETNRCRKISNQQDCDDGYEIGFTGSCVKKCDDGYERNPETNRCRKLVAQASETDVAGAFKIDDSAVANPVPVVTLRWWQIGLGAGLLIGIGLFYKREAVMKWLKRLQK